MAARHETQNLALTAQRTCVRRGPAQGAARLPPMVTTATLKPQGVPNTSTPHWSSAPRLEVGGRLPAGPAKVPHGADVAAAGRWTPASPRPPFPFLPVVWLEKCRAVSGQFPPRGLCPQTPTDVDVLLRLIGVELLVRGHSVEFLAPLLRPCSSRQRGASDHVLRQEPAQLYTWARPWLNRLGQHHHIRQEWHPG